MDYKALYSEYQRNGCLKIENFLTLEEVEELKKGVADIVDKAPDDEKEIFSVYSSGKDKEGDKYYLGSADKIRYFFEQEAFNSEGKLLIDKKEALNKVGYAQHWWHPIFKKITFSQKVKDLFRNFEMKDPIVVQSMLIFKKPKIGEIVYPHQDSTYLYTDPPSCMGLWFPLEDVTLDNACLWFVPGSHKGDIIHQRFVRNPTGDPLLLFEGKNPHYTDDQYIPVPAKKGDCVVIHGSVIHKSGKNLTNKPRTVYTFHVVESAAKWSPLNWVQPTERMAFPSVYSN